MKIGFVVLFVSNHLNMKNLSFSTDNKAVSTNEAIELYLSLKWGDDSKHSEEKMKETLENTTMIISARDESGKLIGLARILSDRVIHTSVVDIVVHPDYQRQRVGKKMMELVKKNFGSTGIFIDAFSVNEKFFLECGYEKREMLVFSKLFLNEPKHIEKTNIPR